jgi:hypothetical protein
MMTDFMIIAATIIAGHIDYSTPSKRTKQFFDETILMCVMYCMMCFSPFVPDLEARQGMGYFCCLIVSVHLFINLFLISSTSIYEFRQRLKMWLA